MVKNNDKMMIQLKIMYCKLRFDVNTLLVKSHSTRRSTRKPNVKRGKSLEIV